MKPSQLRRARQIMCLSPEGLGRMLGDYPLYYTGRAVGAWERGERKIPPSVGKLVRLMLEEFKRGGSE